MLLKKTNKVILLFLFFPTFVVGQCGNGAIYDENRNKCFLFYKTSVDFQSAETICNASKGHLASVHNSIDNNYLTKMAQQLIYVDGPVWLGAKATSQEVSNPKNWEWTDGTPFNYQNYRAGQPSVLDTPACMQFLAGSSKWLTASCANDYPFICMYDPGDVPLTTCPPPKPPRCPSRYAWLEETNSCYRNVVGFMNFTAASANCEKNGGNLTSIHSKLENDFLVGISKTGFNVTDIPLLHHVYIGLIYQDDKWIWTDGTPTDYLNWAKGEPNLMDIEWWGTMLPDPIRSDYNPFGGEWNNKENVKERAHICKFFSNCERTKDNEVIDIDIWYNQYKVKRMFPMECTALPCPEGTYCEKGKQCWEEVKLKNLGKEMKLVMGKWKKIE